MILPDLLNESARNWPEEFALISRNEQMTFSSLETRSNQVASRLRRLGIGVGHRVAILHENSVAAVVFYWGVLKSGAQTVDIPYLSGRGNVETILGECCPQAIVISRPQFQKMTEGGMSEFLPGILLSERDFPQPGLVLNRPLQTLEEIYAAEESDFRPPSLEDSEAAMVIYTSGSTGRPKGVRLSHKNLISNISSVNSLMQLNSTDSLLLVLPLGFIHGRMQLLTHAMIGGTLVLSSGFHFPQQLVDELMEYQTSGFAGVPYHFTSLLERSHLKEASLPDLRYVVITGGAMSLSAQRSLSSALPGVDIHVAYGQTEASPRITNLAPSELFRKCGSCGQAIPGVRLEILAEDGTPLPAGEVGEVVVSGSNVMCGYVSRDEASDGTIDQQDRLHTGDFGRLDREGYLYLAGRKSEMIKSAGERIFPVEIEDIIHTHPQVVECAVLGLADPLFGECVVAGIVKDSGSGVTAEEVRKLCLQFLPFVRVPREIWFVEDLPRAPSGKIDRAKLAVSLESLRDQSRIETTGSETGVARPAKFH